MYRSMLNTVVDRPAAVRVPVDAYMRRLDLRIAKSAAQDLDRDAGDTYRHCSNDFVLFFGGLKQAANDRGLLHDCTAVDLWRVIERNVDVVEPEGDDCV